MSETFVMREHVKMAVRVFIIIIASVEEEKRCGGGRMKGSVSLLGEVEEGI